MAQVNRISSFKSFTEVKNQEAAMKLREENNLKRQETVGKIGAILDEMGVTSLSELEEDKKQALISKMFGNVSEDEAEDIEDEINKLGEPKKLDEGNAFIFAASKARQEGKEEFEFNGKTYKVTLKKDTGLKEGNAFGDAVRKAKEDGETEFEFDGKTYKVEEAIINEGSHGMAKKLLKDIIKGNTSRAEGIKMSKELAEYYLDWIERSEFGKRNSGLPLFMLVKASFNWGTFTNNVPKELKGEVKDLQDYVKANESVSHIDEARSINKIQNEWSKITTEMAELAAQWKAAEGDAKTDLLNQMKAKTFIKKELEKELDAAVAGKDKDLELVVSEAFFTAKDFDKTLISYAVDPKADEIYILKVDTVLRSGFPDVYKAPDKRFHVMAGFMLADNWLKQYKELPAEGDILPAPKKDKVLESVIAEAFYRLPKDIIGNELYLASQNLTNLYNSLIAGNDIDTGVVDSIIKKLNTVKKSAKKFDKAEEIAGTVYEGAVKQFDADFNDMVRNIKAGYGWIDPEYVEETWENSSDSIDFSLVKAEIYKRLIAAKLLAYADDEDEEEAGQYIKSLKELGIKESVVNEAISFEEIRDKYENNPYGIGASSVELEKGSHGNSDRLIFRCEDKQRRDEIEKKLKSMGFATKNLSKSTADKSYAYRYELTLFESLVNEAEIKSDDEFKEYAMTVLKKAFGADFDEAKAGEVADGILKKCDGDYGACVGMLTSSLGESVVTEKFDANYWEDYHEGAGKIENPNDKQLEQEVSGCVEDWNDNNEMGEENEVTSAGEKKVFKLAKEFVKAKGWISSDIIDAMIAQES